MNKTKKHFPGVFLAIIGIAFVAYGYTSNSVSKPAAALKIVFIRHGEKPEKGSNLTCKGLNRSRMIPAMITSKFGVPDFLYVPSLKMAEKTSHARMFETAIPLAVKYNLDIDSKFDESDSANIAKDILQKKGTVLVIWEHKAISSIIHSLGAADTLKWAADDYSTILIVSFVNGKATLTKDTEGLNPSDDCQ